MSAGAHTLGRWLRDRARAMPHRIAIRCEEASVTYAELDRRSERLAAALLARLHRGDRVATLTANRPEHVEVLFACAKAGLALVPLNWRLTPSELAYQLDDADPALLLAEAGRTSLADAALARTSRARPQRGGIERDALSALTGGRDAGGAEVADEDPLLLIYTSGTTGRPKGAVLTHRSCFWTNLSLGRLAPIVPDDVVLAVLPQFHVGGWNVQPLLAWWSGATVLLERAFDPERALGLIAEHRVTAMMGVPATYQLIAELPSFASADLQSLRLAVAGGAPLPADVPRRWRERGVELIEGYGLTEAGPNVLLAGTPYPHVDVALRDPGTGGLVEGAGHGELLVRGPGLFAGYWRNPEASRRAFCDGWLSTGDIAERDAASRYRISGRLKEMFISGGENVYPAEVESALLEHEAIAAAAVVGIADERWGETGVAFIVPAGGARISQAEVVAHAKRLLAGYKVPRVIYVVDELPRSAVGKVLRDELRRRAAR